VTVNILITGIVLGSLYAIVALGYTMVYGIIELINFAHGDIFAFGAFLAIPAISGTTILGWHYPGLITQTGTPSLAESIVGVGVAMLVSALVCGFVAVVIERVAYRRLRNAPRLAPLITAIGISLIIENLLFQWQGGLPITFPQTFPYQSWPFLGTTITNTQILVIVGAAVMMVGLDLFVNRSRLGKAMRAVAQDREAASMMGINVNGIISLTFFVGSFLAGAGSVLYGINIGNISSTDGFTLGLFAFTAAVLGGIGNIRGAALGGLVIGIIAAYVDTLGNGLGSSWYDAVIFAVLVLILVFRPAGILGTNTTEKV
jgi:branched-chain amino acid transport system permease protein